MRRILLIGLAAVVMVPCSSSAQSRKKPQRQPTHVVYVKNKRSDDCCWGNRWFLEPYAGAFNDAYDASPDHDDTALLVGGHVGYHLGRRTRLLGNLGYAKSDDIANPAGTIQTFTYDNTWILTTVGGEFDVIPGRFSASLGLQGGAAWRRVDADGFAGPGPAPLEDEGFSAQGLLVPSLVARFRVLDWASLMAGVHDHMFDLFDGPVQHGVAFTAGIAFR
jgi:hypothetical protein